MNTAVALGIAPSDTLQSTIPHNTETEAFAYAQRFGTQTPLILVTSTLHMPRALFWFQQQGIAAIPAPQIIMSSPTRKSHSTTGSHRLKRLKLQLPSCMNGWYAIRQEKPEEAIKMHLLTLKNKRIRNEQSKEKSPNHRHHRSRRRLPQ